MLRDLTLTDFKSFQHAEMSASGFNLLIGMNASGKSNFREALRVLHGLARGFSLSEVLGGVWRQGDEKEWDGVRGGVLGAFRHGSESFTLAASLEIEVPRHSDADDGNPRAPSKRNVHYLVEIERNPKDQPVIARERLRVGNYGFDTHPDDQPRPGGNDRIITARIRKGSLGAPPDDRFVRDHAILTQVRDSDHATVTLRREIGAVIEALTSMRFLDLQPEPARISSPSGATTLGDNGQNLSSVLEDIVTRSEDRAVLASWVRALTPIDAVDLDFRKDLDGRVLAVLVEGNGALTPLNSASDGTVRFLAMIALLLSPEAPSVIMFEEIENGIHPHRIRLLLELIEETVGRRGIQFFATSHSPFLLASTWEASDTRTLLITRDDSGASTIVDLASSPEIQKVLQAEPPSELMEAGWFEDIAAFLEERDETAA